MVDYFHYKVRYSHMSEMPEFRKYTSFMQAACSRSILRMPWNHCSSSPCLQGPRAQMATCNFFQLWEVEILCVIDQDTCMISCKCFVYNGWYGAHLSVFQLSAFHQQEMLYVAGFSLKKRTCLSTRITSKKRQFLFWTQTHQCIFLQHICKIQHLLFTKFQSATHIW